MTPDDLEANVRERLQQRWNAESVAMVGEPLPSDAAASVLADTLSALRSHTPSSPSRARWYVAAAAIAAAAAAVVVFSRARVPALPRYHEVGFDAGIRAVRSTSPVPSDGVSVLPDSLVRWTLVPDQATSQAVELRVAVRGATQECRELGAGLTIATTGAIEFLGPASALLGSSPGTYELSAVVGSPDAVAAATDPCAVVDGAVLEGIIAVGHHRLELRAPR